MRERVLNFFNASGDEYFVIFTSGATGGLRLVGESFPFTGENSEFVFLENNHNSVVGIREFAAAQGSKFTALKPKEVPQFFSKPMSNIWQNEKTAYSLFAYPAEDNFNGVMYPLEWIEHVHKASTNDRYVWAMDSIHLKNGFTHTTKISSKEYKCIVASIYPLKPALL